MPRNDLKKTLFLFCQTYVENRIVRIQNHIDSIQESLVSETKSSVGDKHETGRAMLQLEREKLGRQLAEAEQMKLALSKVPLVKKLAPIGLGHWVKTTKSDYFLAISAGEFKGYGTSVFCISVGTPMGKLLLGKSVGDVVIFNGEEIEVLEIG